MTKKDDKLPPDLPPPAHRRERRRRFGNRAPGKLDSTVLGSVEHDDLGNAVWNWRVEVPRRRDDDPTIDLLQCLDVDGLEIEDEDSSEATRGTFNPYNKLR